MMMGFGMGFGLLLLVLFFVGIVALVVWMVRAGPSSGGGSSFASGESEASARQILDQRYARGEVTREQYETMKKDIEG